MAKRKESGIVYNGIGAVSRTLGVTKVVDEVIARTIGRQTAATKLSRTEEVALTAGDVGPEQNFFKGLAAWDELRSLPPSQLSAEEKGFIDGPVSDIAARLNPMEINERKDLPPDVWQSMKDSKIWGLIIDKENGGLGYSATAHSDMIVKLGSVSATAAVTAMVPNSLGPGELLMHYGTPRQKEKWLPGLASGAEIPCFALTSKNGGSDAFGGMMNTGTVYKDTDGEIKIRLDISNRYITLAPVATLVGLSFQMKDPDNLLGKGREPGVTLALLPRDTPNLEIGPRHNPLDVYFQNGTVGGKNVVISVDNIIGEEAGIGMGDKMVMESLAVGRSISLPAMSVAAAKLTVQAAGTYARVRRQFKQEIKNFQGVEEPLSRIGGMAYIMDAARKTTLQLVEAGKKPTIPSAIVKYHTTEMMRQVCNDAMDVTAGSAIMQGPRNIFGEIYKAAPIGITVEGANIMTRNFIIFGQGLMRSHPHLFPMIKTAKAITAAHKRHDAQGEAKAKAEFGRLLRRVTTDMPHNLATTVLGTGNQNGPAKDTPPELKKYYARVEHMASGFAFAAGLSASLFQAKLKEMENVSRRLGDIMSNLYLTSAVLNHFEQQGSHKEDLPLVHWSCQFLLNRAEQAFKDLARNYPLKPAGAVIREAVFPAGMRGMAPPSDKLAHQVAKIIVSPNAARERLTAGIYRPQIGETFKQLADDGKTLVDTGYVKPLATLMEAEPVSIASEPVEAKIGKALGLAKKFAEKGEGIDTSHLGGVVRTQQAGDRASVLTAAFNDGVITKEEKDLAELADILRGRALEVDTFTQDMRPL